MMERATDALSLVKKTVTTIGLREPLVEVRHWVTRPDWWVRERRCVRLFRSLFSPGELVFDIGAHKGAYSERLLRLGARVVAVEPQPQCSQAIRQRFGNDSRVTVVPQAVGSVEGTVPMRFCHASQVSSCSPEWPQRFAEQEWDAPVDVPVTTLDALIEQFGTPAFCKIDAEGYEPEILRGLSKPIRAVSLEFTPPLIDKTVRCLDRLHELGYRRINYCHHLSYRYELKQVITPLQAIDRMRNLAAQHHPGGDIYAFLD